MAARNNRIVSGRVRSGRRFAVDIDQPRDKTLGLMVSEDEKRQIDVVAACLGRTRSSFLSMMAVAFIEDCKEGREPSRMKDFYQKCRDAVHGGSAETKTERK